MELKKTAKADLKNKQDIFFMVGLVLALLIVLYAFNIKDQVESADVLGQMEVTEVEEENIPVTRQEELQPPPPPPPPKVFDAIVLADDNVELDEFEFQGSEADEYTVIDALPAVYEEQEEEEEEEPFVVVEDMPEFPGGEAALRHWLVSNVKYPVIAAENGVQGRVYVAFVVDKNGSLSNVRIARGVDSSLDQEALRVVKSMPKWKPGMQRGKPVRVSYTIPINFQLQ